jgi:hypothetical protein
MQLVSHISCSLAFKSISYLAVQGQLSVTQPALPLPYFSISLENFCILPFLSSIYGKLYQALSRTPSHTVRTTRIVLY